MKNQILPIAVIIFSFMLAPDSFAQSKKKLKQMNAQLTTENTELRKSKTELEKKSNSLKTMNEQMKYEVEGLKADINSLQQKNEALQSEVNALSESNEAYEEKMAMYAKSGSGGNVATAGNNMPANSSQCSSRQGKLQNNRTYFVDLSSQIISHGWGVQVYSTADLCDAQGYAEKFEAHYKMWKTYVKVTEQNGQQVYSVVYGSLKYQDQAKVYLENFKKIGRNQDEQNATLVQH
ncbi:SPOR domain-containing protein [Flammeovirga sp. OC4]|uniref:SPOR domain-containing protein n=1 Tax=Flammeovirga sp. OC4 TaxID=1382345 RepID=UPI0005C6ED6E|nr:SPOR domain-containing protein [Flammeovirga sp. OC4]